MGMFTNFTPTNYSPDNRHRDCGYRDETDEIIIGATCTHMFQIPARWEGFIQSGTVIYNQGLEFKFAKAITDDMVKEYPGFTIITVKLSPEDTKKFKYSCLDTNCQLKIVDYNNEVLFDDVRKLRVLKPLEEESNK